MSLYAYVHENKIIEFKEINDDLYTSWIINNNPKKDYYKLVVTLPPPVVKNTEVAEFTYVINDTTVNQVWIVRNKTTEELRNSWTAYQFLLRFTASERASFRSAALTDVNVADFQQLAQAAQEVINDDPMTIAGMNYLVSINLLSEQRKNEILGLI